MKKNNNENQLFKEWLPNGSEGLGNGSEGLPKGSEI